MSIELKELSHSNEVSIGDNESYASLGYDVNMGIEICNGFNLSLNAEALAKAGIDKNLGEFVNASLEIEGGIAAGLQIAMQLSPNVLDNAGLTLVVKAYLKAYIRARLEFGLSAGKLLENVGSNSSELHYQIFEEFLNQLEISVGADANAQIALTASAELVCRLQLLEKDHTKPGFDFRLNGEAAFLFGAGVEFFAMARFTDISGFFTSTKNILLGHIKSQVEKKGILQQEQSELVFRLWSLSMDLIISSSEDELLKKRELSLQSLSQFGIELLTSEIVNTIVDFLQGLIDSIFEWMDENIGQLGEKIEQIVKFSGDFQSSIGSVQSLSEIVDLFDKIIEIAVLLGFDKSEELNEIGTHIYLLGFLLDKENEAFWSSPPNYVLEDYKTKTGNSISGFTHNDDVYAYLEQSKVIDLLIGASGSAGAVLEDLLTTLHQNQLTLVGLIQILFDQEDSQKEQLLFEIMLSYLESAFEKFAVEPIKQKVQPAFAKSDLGGEYYDAVFENSINSFSKLFIPLLKSAFAQDPDKATYDELSFVSKRFLLGFIARNISFFTNEMISHSTKSITNNLNDCIRKITGGQFRFMAHQFFDDMEDKINQISPLPGEVSIPEDTKSELILVSESFLKDVFIIAKEALGEDTWTEERIDTLTEKLEMLIANPDNKMIDFSSMDVEDVKSKLLLASDCGFFPDFSKDELTEMSEVLQEIGWKQFQSFLLDIPGRTAEYIIDLLEILFVGPISELIDLIMELLGDASAAAAKLLAEIEGLIEGLENGISDALEDIETLIDELQTEIISALNSYFDFLKENLNLEDGSWITEFIDFLVFWDDLDSDQERAEAVIEELRTSALNGVNDADVRADLVRISKRDGFDDTTVSKWIRDSILTEDIKEELKKMKFTEFSSAAHVWPNHYDKVFAKSEELRLKSNSRWSDILMLEYENDRKYNQERILNQTEKQTTRLEELERSNITINSPLMVDSRENDLPIYGKYVYLEIDFDHFKVKEVVENQLEINAADLVQDGEISNERLAKFIRESPNKSSLIPIQVKILINGRELDLKTMSFFKNRASGHLHKDLLKKGVNDLSIFVVAPSQYEQASFSKHIQFMSSGETKSNYPSNSIFIDPAKSVFDSEGNDHADAANEDVNEKEAVFITNNSGKLVNLNGWILKDAAGHSFTLGKGFRIKPGSSRPIYIGNTDSGHESWIEHYNNWVIAVLNNKGEFLKLENPDGKVVSQMYYGYPSSNKDINFILAKS